jgi:hypothetical protein
MMNMPILEWRKFCKLRIVMKIKTAIASIAVAVSLLGCASVSDEFRVPSNIKSLEFNSLSSQYMSRPTFLKILKMSDGTEILKITMDSYGPAKNGVMPSISIATTYVDENIEMLEKYLSWVNTAKEREDQFTKEIGKVNSWDNGATLLNRYTFHSGNQYSHFVEIVTCSLGICNPSEQSPIMLDPEGAKSLIKELQMFKKGEFKKTDLDTVYN